MVEVFRSRLDQAVVERIFPGYSFAYIANGVADVFSGGHFTYDEKSP